MHVVDDVHCLIVHASDLVEHLLVICHYLVIVEHIALERLDALNHECAGVLATTAVKGKKKSLGKVGTSSEELDCLTDRLV